MLAPSASHQLHTTYAEASTSMAALCSRHCSLARAVKRARLGPLQQHSVQCSSSLLEPASVHASVGDAQPLAAAQELALAPPHVSVLLQEVLHFFSAMQLKVFVDGTLGAGGHSSSMLQQHRELQTLVGIDLDPTALHIARQRLEGVQREQQQQQQQQQPAGSAGPATLHLLRGNYSAVWRLLEGVPGGSLVGQADGMLLDLGVSSMQIDSPERGFSFMHDGPIDMRLDPDAALSAEEVVNTWSEAELGRVLRDYGEEKLWRTVARRIVAAREAGPITTTSQLVSAVGHTIKPSKGGKGNRHIHPATRTFQALRIAVNDEMRLLEQALPDAISCLAPGGRLAVISFHSLEDRLVKHAFLRAAGRPTPAEEALTRGPNVIAQLEALEARAVGSLVTRKPVVPGEEEVSVNARSRSAKLRVFEKAGGAAAEGDERAGAGWRRGGASRLRRRQRDAGQQAPVEEV